MMSFESFVRLGWSFFRTVVRGLFARKPELPRFEAQYRPDGMLSSVPDDHTVHRGVARCYGCGTCDLVALERGAFEALGPRGPMGFVQGVSRQAGVDLPLTDAATPALLGALETACPVRVPFVALASLVRRRHAEYAEATRALPAGR